MKTFTLILTILLGIEIAYAQAPHQFSFQGVARNAAGKILANQNISLRLTIRPTTGLGTPVYQETHATQTSAHGVFNISVGAGLVQSGDFSSIKWDSDKFFLQTELDPDGGGNYVNLGATQLLSVPYALHAEEAGKWGDDQPVIQEGKYLSAATFLPTLEWSSPRTRMLWYPRKAALRFGLWTQEHAWTDENIGENSFAAGTNAIAGSFGFAFGTGAKTTGQNGVAIGNGSEAVGASVALGYNVHAAGNNSIAIGRHNMSLAADAASIGYNLHSRSKYGIVLGANNDRSDALSDEIKPTQRIFQLGNGDVDQNTYSNALTVLRNGNVGIGNNVLQPTHILDVGSRLRLRSTVGNTAGLWLDDNGGAQYCFLGGYDNDQAGFYFEDGGWRFTVNKNGNAFLGGALTQNSDVRLKRDIRPLSPNFKKLSSISGRHYYWKDPQRSQGLQTGLIAQEVETVFPELVETDKDGYKSVNYIGLIPHLLEAVKELKQENSRLSSENEKLISGAGEVTELRKRLEAIEASIAKDPAVSVK